MSERSPMLARNSLKLREFGTDCGTARDCIIATRRLEMQPTAKADSAELDFPVSTGAANRARRKMTCIEDPTDAT